MDAVIKEPTAITPNMGLFLDAGYTTAGGKRGENYDACFGDLPEDAHMNTHGALLAIADGLVELPGATEAARSAIESLKESYFSAFEGWGAQRALLESINAANDAVLSGGERGRAASLTALVLRRRRWLLGHAGNTRAWLYRDQTIKLLSHDHVHPRPTGKAYVTRACGLAPQLDAEVSSGELVEGDVFILTSDGAHDVLESSAIISALQGDLTAGQLADNVVQVALKNGAHDSVTVCVVRVEGLPAETDIDLQENISALAIINPPSVGEPLDGFVIQDLIHKSSRYRLYKALDTETSETVVLKFPNPRFGRDPEYTNHFLHEEWIGKRLDHPSLIRMLQPRPGRRSALYSIMAHYTGENLSLRIRRKRGIKITEMLKLADQLLDTLDHLHQKGVIHRDIRPKNLLYDRKHRRLLLIGLGSSYIEDLGEKHELAHVTRSAIRYTAPEILSGGEVNERSDIFSAGATMYRMLTAKYPFGRPAENDASVFSDFTAPSRWRPEIPAWLDEVLARACAPDPPDRYASANAFAQALVDNRVSAVSAYRAHSGSVSEPAAMGGSQWATRWGWVIIGVLVVSFLVYLVAILSK